MRHPVLQRDRRGGQALLEAAIVIVTVSLTIAVGLRTFGATVKTVVLRQADWDRLPIP